jgi:hypothetical protein
VEQLKTNIEATLTTITLKEIPQSSQTRRELIFTTGEDGWNFAVVNVNNRILQVLINGEPQELQQEELRAFENVKTVEVDRTVHITVLLTIASKDDLQTRTEYTR